MVHISSKALTLEEFLKLPETKPACEYIIPNQQLELYQDDRLIVLDGIDLQLTAEQIFSWLKMSS
jgi:cytidylate kinase